MANDRVRILPGVRRRYETDRFRLDMTSHKHMPYGASTNRLRGHPPRRYEIVIIHGLVGRNTESRFPPRIATHATAQNLFAYSCTVTVLPCTVPRTLTFETVTNTSPRTVTVTSADVPLAHRGPASATGCVARTRRWWRPSPSPAEEQGEPPPSRLQVQTNGTVRRTPW